MASTLTYDIVVELKSPIDAVWNAVKELDILLPKFQPETYNSTEIVEGNGNSAGTVSLVTYVKGAKAGCGNYYKSKCESLDEENKTIVYRYLEGDILKFYRFFNNKITVKPKGEGSIVVSTCIYRKALFMAPDAESMSDSAVEMFEKLDAYLLGNNKN